VVICTVIVGSEMYCRHTGVVWSSRHVRRVTMLIVALARKRLSPVAIHAAGCAKTVAIRVKSPSGLAVASAVASVKKLPLCRATRGVMHRTNAVAETSVDDGNSDVGMTFTERRAYHGPRQYRR